LDGRSLLIGELRKEAVEDGITGVPSAKMSFTDLRRLTDLLDERTGMRFGPKRFGAVRTCVVQRMKALGITALEDYINHALHPDHPEEFRQVADLMVADGG